MVDVKTGYRGKFSQLLKDIADNFFSAWGGWLTLKIRKATENSPLGKYMLPVYGMGFNGGPIDALKVNEIVLKGGKIIGFRNYKEGEESPLKSIDEIEWDDKKIKGYKTGTKVISFHNQYDPNFTNFGSAYTLTNDDFSEEGMDVTQIQGEFMDDALRFYAAFGKRKRLGAKDGQDISVIEIPRTYTLEEFWKDMEHGKVFGAFKNYFSSLVNGFDSRLAGYFLAQTVVYKALDTLFYNPLLERVYKAMKKVNGKINIEQYVKAQYIASTNVVNNAMGLERNADALYSADFA